MWNPKKYNKLVNITKTKQIGDCQRQGMGVVKVVKRYKLLVIR